MLGGICNSPHGCLAGCGLSTSSSALDTKKLAGENSCKAGRLRCHAATASCSTVPSPTFIVASFVTSQGLASREAFVADETLVGFTAWVQRDRNNSVDNRIFGC
ncbi:hypothetical protein V6N13_072608 [Hibiscus sabdariffa]